MTNHSSKPTLETLCAQHGDDSKALRAALKASKVGRRLSKQRVSKLTTVRLKKFLRKNQNQPNSDDVLEQLQEILNVSVSHGMLRKNPLKRRVGYARHYASAAAIALCSVAVLALVCFGVAVAQRAQQTQEDPLLASADVARDIGWGEAVAMFENFYYGQVNPAKIGGLPVENIKSNALIGAEANHPFSTNAKANIKAWGAAEMPSKAPTAVVSPASPKLAGEGQWLPTKIVVNGHVAVRIARVRPDATHTSYLDTLVWFDPRLLAFQDIPGTLEPRGNFARGKGKVTPSFKPFYVAGINGGYKTDNMHGGFIYRGQTVIPMRKGVATFLTYPDGSFNVAAWGVDPIKPGFTAARQNLLPLVENGKNMAKKDTAAKWGSVSQGVSSGHIFVWRSAIGVRADGTIIHLIGPSLSTRDLADLLIRAGVVRGMALDMNNGWASSFFYGPYGSGAPMDPQITHTTSRFRVSSTRDFIAVFAKSPENPAK